MSCLQGHPVSNMEEGVIFIHIIRVDRQGICGKDMGSRVIILLYLI